MTGFNAKEDRRHYRRTLGVEGLRKVIEVAHYGPPWRKMTGPMRRLCYRLAVATGLRYSEIQSILPKLFNWSSIPSTVTVSAAYTKNGEPATLPLSADLREDLFTYVASLPSGEPIFPLAPDCGAKMLRPDLERAGIPYFDAGGLVFDFHALRCQCATLADQAGVTPRVVQKLLRHSTLELTGRYTRPRAVDIKKAAEFLPSLRPDTNHPIASTLATSGTDGQPISKAFAEYLPNSGDGLSRNLSLPDVMTKSDDPKMMNGLTLEKAGDDAYCRVDSHPVESTGVGTRTPDLRIMRPPL